MITPQTYIQVYIHTYIHIKPLPVPRVFGARSGSPRIIVCSVLVNFFLQKASTIFLVNIHLLASQVLKEVIASCNCLESIHVYVVAIVQWQHLHCTRGNVIALSDCLLIRLSIASHLYAHIIIANHCNSRLLFTS